MANPNPFLFGAPPVGAAEPPNPFLGGGDPSAAANPFGGGMANPFGGGMAAPVMHQAQPHYGAFATPPPAADASNPFASFCPPTQPVQPPSSLFGDSSAYYPQSMQQPQPQHQQHYGQFGQYSQVTADSFSQPNVTASVQSPPVPQPSNDLPKINPFAAAMDTPPFEQVEAPSPPVQPQATEKHPPESTAEKKLLINSEETRATEIIPNSQEEIPPPPPLNITQEEIKILPEQSTDENLPPPPAQEALTDDGPLPPPPGIWEAVAECEGNVEPLAEQAHHDVDDAAPVDAVDAMVFVADVEEALREDKDGDGNPCTDVERLARLARSALAQCGTDLQRLVVVLR